MTCKKSLDEKIDKYYMTPRLISPEITKSDFRAY